MVFNATLNNISVIS